MGFFLQILTLAVSMYKSFLSVKFGLIACPSAWSIQVSFFYVPKKYPKKNLRQKLKFQNDLFFIYLIG